MFIIIIMNILFMWKSKESVISTWKFTTGTGRPLNALIHSWKGRMGKSYIVNLLTTCLSKVSYIEHTLIDYFTNPVTVEKRGQGFQVVLVNIGEFTTYAQLIGSAITYIQCKCYWIS